MGGSGKVGEACVVAGKVSGLGIISRSLVDKQVAGRPTDQSQEQAQKCEKNGESCG